MPSYISLMSPVCAVVWLSSSSEVTHTQVSIRCRSAWHSAVSSSGGPENLTFLLVARCGMLGLNDGRSSRDLATNRYFVIEVPYSNVEKAVL